MYTANEDPHLSHVTPVCHIISQLGHMGRATSSRCGFTPTILPHRIRDGRDMERTYFFLLPL
jgi:hypothetical protein